MYLLGFLLLFATLVRCNDNKIVNSERTANVKKFPYVCFIKRYFKIRDDPREHKEEQGWRIQCSGSLLSMKHVVTTARCVERIGFKYSIDWFTFRAEENTELFKVVAGTIYTNESGAGVQIRKVEKLIVPKKVYREKKQYYRDDVSILLLKKTFVPTIYVMVAPFLKIEENFPDDETAYCPYKFKVCDVPGWGHLGSSRNLKSVVYSFNRATELQVASVQPLKLDECHSRICEKYQTIKEQFSKNPCSHIYKFQWSTVFCALATNETDVCYFDEGSPLVCEGLVIGFLTFVDPYFGCGRGGPAGYVSLRAVLNFIKSAFPKSNASIEVAHWMLVALLAASNIESVLNFST